MCAKHQGPHLMHGEHSVNSSYNPPPQYYYWFGKMKWDQAVGQHNCSFKDITDFRANKGGWTLSYLYAEIPLMLFS